MKDLYLGALLALASLTPAAGAVASTESVLYSFKGGTGDGANPETGLLAGANGTFYGTTQSGGLSTELGTVFQLTPPAAGAKAWTEKVIYRFKGGNDGDQPMAGLIADAKGALYGTTEFGGTDMVGTVFKLAPPASGKTAWTETVLHCFSGADGQNPVAGPVMDAQGVLYGTTASGGTYGQGVAFRLSPPAGGTKGWSLKVLHAFKGGGDGADVGGVMLDKTGMLYGTTVAGGAAGHGTVYRLAPPAAGSTAWTKQVLHAFTGGSDGGAPAAAVIEGSGGALYGTTSAGALAADTGTVFRLTPPATGKSAWTFKVLHAFKGEPDGASPHGVLTAAAGGVLYGTTAFGGIGWGTVFKLTPPTTGTTAWTETVLHGFGAVGDGAGVFGGVVAGPGGALYGTTADGGSAGHGVVFKLVP